MQFYLLSRFESLLFQQITGDFCHLINDIVLIFLRHFNIKRDCKTQPVAGISPRQVFMPVTVFFHIIPQCMQGMCPLPGRNPGLFQTVHPFITESIGFINRTAMDSLGNILIPTRFREIRSLGGDRLLLLSEGETVLSDMDGTALKRWVTAQTEAPTGEAGE